MSAQQPELIVFAGQHDRSDCPIEFQYPGYAVAETITLIGTDGSALLAQRMTTGWYAAVIPWLRANTSAQYQLITDSALSQSRLPSHTAHAIETDSGTIDLCVNGNLFTRYVYGGVPARPYFYPICEPSGAPVTRAYPMHRDVFRETQDHPHHRSIWVAHGDVNGTDNWSEEPGHGFTRHLATQAITSGSVAAGFVTDSIWETASGAPLLTQRLKVTAWATSQTIRLLDIEIDLTADHVDVTFGDTKEGGIASFRVASSMDVPRGGRIINSYGGVDEAESWGRPAHWCDYSGVTEGVHCGIAVLDHPTSFRHPTTWHVRNYGLMTANPFGWAAFTSGEKNGTHTLPKGETLKFRYRIVIHYGDAKAGNVSGHYINYAFPPRPTVTGV